MDPHLDERLTAIESKLSAIEKTVVKIRKVQRRTNTARGVYWLFIILLGLGAFYFVQPYITQLKDTYRMIGDDSQNFEELIKQFQGEDR